MDEERLAKVEQEKQNAINQSNNMYNGLLQDNQNLYNTQNEYANTYEQTQNDILDKQLAYNTNLIEQQKEIARQNKETEEKKAKNDYTQFINPYGYRNENLAERGLLKSGVSETSMLGGFNAYQNRLAAANKVMQDAFVQYDNDINQARLNNDVQKAQNALNKLKMQVEFSQNFYNNKSTISQNQLNNNQTLDNNYYNRYQTEYGNIQAEKERAEKIRQWKAQFAEEQRQYNENLALKKQQAAQDQANWEKEYALSRQKASSSSSRSSGGSSLTNSGSTLLEGSNTDNNSGIIKNPYTGTINPDTKYGVFDTGNGTGYQPNNVNGVKLSKSGKTVSEFLGTKGNTGSTGINIDNQNVWKANGRYYTWDGTQDKYVDITDYENTGNTTKGGGKGSFGFGGKMGFR